MSTQQFIARHGDTEKPVTVERLKDGRYRVALDGHSHEVDARRFAAGTWSVLIDEDSYDVELEVSGPSESNGAYNVLVRGQVVSLHVLDERQVRMGLTSSKLAVEGPQTVTAPMPGKIVDILVKVGDEVEDGASLIIMEAMKMENELKSPRAGKVSAIFAQKDATVEAGAKLATIE